MSATDPQVVTNPPGLPAIADRVNDFAGFREALLQPLPGEQAIGAWRPVPGDLGLQVLEWWAYVADVLTFYNERHANESYLRTATRASSVANLVALLGYQPAPGIAASGTLAVLGKPRGAEGPLAIPAGMQVSSVASPGTPSQTFEVDQAASFTGPSTLAAALPADTSLQLADDGTLPVLLAGRITSIKPGTAAPGRERLRGGERRLVRDHRQCHRSNRRPGHRRREHARHAERVDVGVAIVRLAEPAPGAQLGLR